MIEVCLWHWLPLLEEDTPLDSPKPPLVWGREEKKTIVE
jgi:hypothetical protein